MSILEVIAVVTIGYFLGSVSFACIIAKKHGINILKAGSGNPGATNVKRVIGKKAGNICFALDFIKGCLASGFPLLPFLNAQEPNLLGLIGLAAAIFGHSFSIFLKFRGGKGVAVTMGGLAILLPAVFITGILTWLIVFYTTRYVSLASIAFGVSLPVTAIITYSAKSEIIFSLLLMLIILIRHRSNLKRLANGEETKFAKKKLST